MFLFPFQMKRKQTNKPTKQKKSFDLWYLVKQNELRKITHIDVDIKRKKEKEFEQQNLFCLRICIIILFNTLQ